MWIVPKKSRSLHRNLAQEMIHSGVLRGLKSSYIVKSLKEAGLGYHLQNMYQDIKGWRNALNEWQKVNTNYYNSPIPTDVYVESQRHLESNLETVVSLKIRNKTTGEISERYVTVRHKIWTPFGGTEMVENRYTVNDLIDIAKTVLGVSDPTAEAIGGRVLIGYKRA